MFLLPLNSMMHVMLWKFMAIRRALGAVNAVQPLSKVNLPLHFRLLYLGKHIAMHMMEKRALRLCMLLDGQLRLTVL